MPARGRRQLARIPWPPEQKEMFLRMQFEAQHRHYHQHFAGADFLIIQRDGEAVGRLYVHRRAGEIGVVEIALLPAHRNAGLGTRLMNDLIVESEASARPLSIHVEKHNRALLFYLRLGFVQLADKGIYLHLTRAPKLAAA
ncbi:MAG: GNAT family N-acetyltransferase [Chthoniobacteraceae bacterium]